MLLNSVSRAKVSAFLCSAEMLHPRLCRVARHPLQDGGHLVVAQQFVARRADDLGDPLGKLALFDELPPLFVLVGRLVGFKLARRLVAQHSSQSYQESIGP